MFFNLLSRLSYFLADFKLYLLLIFSSFAFCCLLIYKIYKSKFSPRKKKIYLSLAFTLFILVLVFSSFEAYFRYVYDQSDGLGFLKVNSKWHQRHVVYNNYFFRDRNFETNKKEGIIRIGVLGDSIAFGGGIKNVQDRFSNILEDQLKNSGYSTEVYNLGKLGYDTESEIGEYEKVKHLNFDIIIWQYFLNDIQPLEKSTGTPIISRNSQSPKIIRVISDQSFFLDFLYWRLSQRYQKTFEELKNADLAQYTNDQVFKNHQQEIASFISSLKKDNKKVIVIIFPFVHLLPDYPASKIHEQMSQIFEENGVEVIDLLDYLKDKNAKDLIASKFDSHPNEAVHKIAAEKLFEKVQALLK